AGLGQHLRNRVITMGSAGAAAPEPGQPHPAAGPGAEAPDAVAGEFRTGRQMPAGPPRESRERVAVDRNEKNGGELERKVHGAPDRRSDSIHEPATPSA